MRRTRLVILPGARCLGQMCALLLYLSCPNIGATCREHLDISRDDLYADNFLKLCGNTEIPTEGEELCYVAESRINCGTKHTGNHNGSENICFEKLPDKFSYKLSSNGSNKENNFKNYNRNLQNPSIKLVSFEKNVQEINNRITRENYSSEVRRNSVDQTYNLKTKISEARRMPQQTADIHHNVKSRNVPSRKQITDTTRMRMNERLDTRKSLREIVNKLKQGTQQNDRENYNRRFRRQDTLVGQNGVDHRFNDRVNERSISDGRFQKLKERRLPSERTDLYNFRKSDSRRSGREENRHNINLQDYGTTRREQIDHNRQPRDFNIRRSPSDSSRRLSLNRVESVRANHVFGNERLSRSERSLDRVSSEQDKNRRLERETQVRRVLSEQDLRYRSSLHDNRRLSREERGTRRIDEVSSKEQKSELRFQRSFESRANHMVGNERLSRSERSLDRVSSNQDKNRRLEREIEERRVFSDQDLRYRSSLRDNRRLSREERDTRQIDEVRSKEQKSDLRLQRLNRFLGARRHSFEAIVNLRNDQPVSRYERRQIENNGRAESIRLLNRRSSEIDDYRRYNRDADSGLSSSRRDISDEYNLVHDRLQRQEVRTITNILAVSDRSTDGQREEPSRRVRTTVNTRQISTQQNNDRLISKRTSRDYRDFGIGKRATSDHLQIRSIDNKLNRKAEIRTTSMKRVTLQNINIFENRRLIPSHENIRRSANARTFDNQSTGLDNIRRLKREFYIQRTTSERIINTEMNPTESKRLIRDNRDVVHLRSENSLQRQTSERKHNEKLDRKVDSQRSDLVKSEVRGSSTDSNSRRLINHREFSRRASIEQSLNQRFANLDNNRRLGQKLDSRSSSLERKTEEGILFRNMEGISIYQTIETKKLSQIASTNQRTRRDSTIIDKERNQRDNEMSRSSRTDNISNRRNIQREINGRLSGGIFRHVISDSEIRHNSQENENRRENRRRISSDQSLNYRSNERLERFYNSRVISNVEIRRILVGRINNFRENRIGNTRLSPENEITRRFKIKRSITQQSTRSDENRIFRQHTNTRLFSNQETTYRSADVRNRDHELRLKIDSRAFSFSWDLQRNINGLNERRSIRDDKDTRQIPTYNSFDFRTTDLDNKRRRKNDIFSAGRLSVGRILELQNKENIIHRSLDRQENRYLITNGLNSVRRINRSSLDRQGPQIEDIRYEFNNKQSDDEHKARRLDSNRHINRENNNRLSVIEYSLNHRNNERKSDINLNNKPGVRVSLTARNSRRNSRDNVRLIQDLHNNGPITLHRTQVQQVKGIDRRTVTHMMGIRLVGRSDYHQREFNRIPFETDKRQFFTEKDIHETINQRDSNYYNLRSIGDISEVLEKVRSFRQLLSDHHYNRRILHRRYSERIVIPDTRDRNDGRVLRETIRMFNDKRSTNEKENTNILSTDNSRRRVARNSLQKKISRDTGTRHISSAKPAYSHISRDGIINLNRIERVTERLIIRERRMPDTLRNERHERTDERVNEILSRDRRLFRIKENRRITQERNSRIFDNYLEINKHQQRNVDDRLVVERVSKRISNDQLDKVFTPRKSDNRRISEIRDQRRFVEQFENRRLIREQRNTRLDTTKLMIRIQTERFDNERLSRNLKSSLTITYQNYRRISEMDHFTRREHAEIKNIRRSVVRNSFERDDRRNFYNVRENRNGGYIRSLLYLPVVGSQNSENPSRLTEKEDNTGDSFSEKETVIKLRNEHGTDNLETNIERINMNYAMEKEIPNGNIVAADYYIDQWKLSVPGPENVAEIGINEKSTLEIIQDSFSYLWSMKQETKAALVGSAACLLLTSNVK